MTMLFQIITVKTAEEQKGEQDTEPEVGKV